MKSASMQRKLATYGRVLRSVASKIEEAANELELVFCEPDARNETSAEWAADQVKRLRATAAQTAQFEKAVFLAFANIDAQDALNMTALLVRDMSATKKALEGNRR
ncbi:MAG TPA: hypothetical protein VHF22_10960 [Planctomycetota bacterium]|nr:hypothetical protein [Planctomycetota bacterium]